MWKHSIIVGFLTLLVIVVIYAATVHHATAAASSADNAIRTAARQNRYIFITFYKQNDRASAAMLTSVQTLQGRLANRADFIRVDVNAQDNRAVVARFSANRSPIPLTIVVAPNGAVTAGYPREINANADFSSVFVSAGNAAVLKVLQGNKLAVACLLCSRTRYNNECVATANGIAADPRLGGAAEVVKINIADRAEAKFIQQCSVDGNCTNSQIVVFAPSGKVMGRFDGNTPKDAAMTSLLRTLGGGCSGGQCGPGGCGGK